MNRQLTRVQLFSGISGNVCQVLSLCVMVYLGDRFGLRAIVAGALLAFYSWSVGVIMGLIGSEQKPGGTGP